VTSAAELSSAPEMAAELAPVAAMTPAPGPALVHEAEAEAVAEAARTTAPIEAAAERAPDLDPGQFAESASAAISLLDEAPAVEEALLAGQPLPETDVAAIEEPALASDASPDEEALASGASPDDEPMPAEPVTAEPATVSPRRAAPTNWRAAPATLPAATRGVPGSLAAATCPYCAAVLDPPPVASGRCPRCRHRILVKRISGRPIYLTEAALPIFEAERRRAAHAPRWTRDRDRWLALATAARVPADRIDRVRRTPLSDEVVAAARGLYLSHLDRAVRELKHDRRWDEAARLRFEEATALQRVSASLGVLPEEVVEVHRDGLGALLRGIGEVARTAELRAGTCCGTCRSDDGRAVRIAIELHSPTLPHAECPKGPCKCRWFLADRDRTIVTGLLRRQRRAPRRG